MSYSHLSRSLLLLICLALILSVSGVFATWIYAELPLFQKFETFFIEMKEFVWPEPEVFDLYITDIQQVSGPNNVSFEKKHPTTISTELTVTANTTVTYKVTLHNNTDITYWYRGQKYNSASGSNALLGNANGVTVTTKDAQSDTTGTFNTDDWIPPHTTRDIYVTYTYGSDARGVVTNVIDLSFGLRMDAIYDQFLIVLNDKTSDYGYDYLADAFNNKYSETGSTIIGNVGEDEAIFDYLFGPDLTVNWGGQEVPVTVMICRENVDKTSGTGDAYKPSGPAGCEYTVYISIDPLESATGEAIVYAISYTRDKNGEWKQVGQLYEGVADRMDYDPTTSTLEGAFDIRTWEATPAYYEIADGIVYIAGLPKGQGDQYDQYKTIQELMSAKDHDIYNAIDNAGLFKNVYNIIKNSSADTPGIDGLKAAFEAAAPYYNNYNNGQEFKVNRSCSRAELIPVIIAIQHALDYYNEVN